MSVIVKSAGGGSAKPELFTYVLHTESGDEGLLQYEGVEEVTLTATAGDIRTGMTAITDDGVITGTFAGVDTSGANAVAEDILLGKTAYVNGEKVEGNMTNNGAVSQILTSSGESYTIPKGYHDGTGTITAPNFVAYPVSRTITLKSTTTGPTTQYIGISTSQSGTYGNSITIGMDANVYIEANSQGSFMNCYLTTTYNY